MTAARTLEEIGSRLRRECRDDEVAFSEVVRAAQHSLPDEDAYASVRKIAEMLLLDSDVQFGQWHASEPTFVVWSGSPATVVARMVSSWQALGREPHPGDIGWFSAPHIRDIPHWLEETSPTTKAE